MPAGIFGQHLANFAKNEELKEQLERGTRKVGDQEGEAKPLRLKAGCV